MPGLEGVSGNEIEIHSHFFSKVRHVSASIKKKEEERVCVEGRSSYFSPTSSLSRWIIKNFSILLSQETLPINLSPRDGGAENWILSSMSLNTSSLNIWRILKESQHGATPCPLSPCGPRSDSVDCFNEVETSWRFFFFFATPRYLE